VQELNKMPSKTEYRYELYNRWMDDPVNPELNEWWTGLDPIAQDSLSELHRRGKTFEQEEIQAIEFDEYKQTLVDEILNQDYINADLFKTKISRQLTTDSPDDIGLIKYNRDGGRDVINDPSALNVMMMDDKMPYGMNPDEMGKWSADMQKKDAYEKQGYKLYNISQGYVLEPPKKEKTILDIVREPYVGQWQGLANSFIRARTNTERVDIMKKMGNEPSYDHIVELAVANSKLKDLRPSEAVAMYHQEEDWGELFKKLSVDPAEILSQLFVESMTQFLPSLFKNALKYVPLQSATYATYGGWTAGVPGAVAGGITGLAHGVVTATGITSYNMEYTSKTLESFEESGVDITNANQLMDAFMNEELMAEVKAKATKKSIPIAGLDMISGGIAGKLNKLIPNKVLGHTAEVVAQMSAGGGGELWGQVWSGEEISPSAILSEMIMEPVQSMPAGYGLAD